MGNLRVDVDNLTSVTITSMQQEKTKLDSCYADMIKEATTYEKIKELEENGRQW